MICRSVIFTIAIITLGCGKYAEMDVGEGGFGNTSSIVAISGYVFTDTSLSDNSGAVLPFHYDEKYDEKFQFAMSPSICAAGSYSLFYLGMGSSPVFTDTTSTDGLFDIPEVPMGVEGLLEFDCTGDGNIDQRCIVKAGDEGVSCNIISDAVVDALEESLSVSLRTDSQVRGRTIARMAQNIAETASSEDDETDELISCPLASGTTLTDMGARACLRAQLESCRTLHPNNPSARRGCVAEEISNSPVSSSTFEIVKTLAQTWKVETLFNFVAEVLGFDVRVDDILYTGLGELINFTMGTDFITESKSLVNRIITRDQYNGNLKVDCRLDYLVGTVYDYASSGTIYYSPDPSTHNPNEMPKCINESAIINQIPEITVSSLSQLVMDHIDQEHSNNCVNVTTGATLSRDNAQNMNPGHVCLFVPYEPVITLVTRENDRNDPDGQYQEFHGEKSVNMIDIFEPLFPALLAIHNDPTKPSNCFSFSMSGGPPSVNTSNTQCRNWLVPRFVPLKPYFAGLLGLYIYLAEAESNQRNIRRFSLEEIYKIMGGELFLDYKIVGRGQWDNYEHYRPDNCHVSPVLKREGLNIFRFQDIFTDPNQNCDDLIHARNHSDAILPYDLTIFPLRNVPRNNDIAQVINNALTHRPWNRTGSPTMSVAFMSSSYINGETDREIPIFCQVTNNQLTCDNDPYDAEVSKDPTNMGAYTFPGGYEYNLVLGFHDVKHGRTNDGPQVFRLINKDTGRSDVTSVGDILFAVEKYPLDRSPCDHGAFSDIAEIEIGTDADPVLEDAYCFDNSAGTTPPAVNEFMDQYLETTYNVFSGNQAHQDFRLFTDSGSAGDTLCLNITGSDNFEYNTDGFVITKFGFESGPTGGYETIFPTAITGDTNFTVDKCTLGGHPLKIHPDSVIHSQQAISDKEGYFVYLEYNGTSLVGTRIQIFQEADNIIYDANEPNEYIFAQTTGVNVYNFGDYAHPLFQRRFDPFCDANDLTGECECVNPSGPNGECRLQDIPSDLTFSQNPFHIHDEDEDEDVKNAVISLFNDRGGFDMGSSEVQAIYNELSDDTKKAYFENQIYPFVTCKYIASGENIRRKVRGPISTNDSPRQLLATSENCPVNNGTGTGGPTRIANVQPRNNSFLISKPQEILRAFNYATKTIGSGVTISPSQRVFTFDEALALISYRLFIPMTNIQVYHADNSINAGAQVVSPRAFIQQVRVNDQYEEDEMNFIEDPIQGVLQSIAFPELLDQTPLHQ